DQEVVGRARGGRHAVRPVPDVGIVEAAQPVLGGAIAVPTTQYRDVLRRGFSLPDEGHEATFRVARDRLDKGRAGFRNAAPEIPDDATVTLAMAEAHGLET